MNYFSSFTYLYFYLKRRKKITLIFIPRFFNIRYVQVLCRSICFSICFSTPVVHLDEVRQVSWKTEDEIKIETQPLHPARLLVRPTRSIVATQGDTEL